jgi:hypothetical protein
MKKSIKLIAIFCFTLFVFSCNKDYKVWDESSPAGVYPFINDPNGAESVLFYAGQGASSYKAKLGLSGPAKAEKLDAYVVTGSVLTFVKTFALPATTTYEVTLQEVADALGVPLSNFNPGDQIILRNVITTTDGKTWDQSNISHLSGGLLSGTPYQNLFADVSVFVTCPFVADDAVGNYQVQQDDWADYNPGDNMPVTSIGGFTPDPCIAAANCGPSVVKIDATHIQIDAYPYTFGNNHNGVIITVDPTSGAATVTKQFNGGYGATDTEYTAGSGFVFSCVGYIKLTLNFTYNGGAYNGNTLIITKL